MMNEDQLKMENLLQEIVSHATNFFDGIDNRPVVVHPDEWLRDELPEIGIGASDTMKYFTQHYAKGLSGSNGPRYLGFVTGGATPASIMGDWLVSVYDQNLSNSQDSIAGLIETETIEMLKVLLHLKADYTGSFVSGATMSNFVGLAQARQWVAHHYGIDASTEGIINVPSIKIVSGAPHSSIFKNASMLGLGREAIELIPCQENREAIDINKLEAYLEKNQHAPCIVIANAGTVNTGDFDDFVAIGQLKKRYSFWLHIDAAFGGFAACSPLYADLIAGINEADSITVDAHKWLNVPYDSAMQFTRHRLLQTEVFQNKAAYLGGSIEQPEFFDLTPENSRRFRALPAWFSLKAYGQQGYQQIIEQNIEVAKGLGNLLENSQCFKLLSPVKLNVVCFTLNETEVTLTKIQEFLARLSQQGKVFMTPTVYKGKPGIRAAFSNWRTNEADLKIIWRALEEARG